MYTPEILSEKHLKRSNDIPHAKSPYMIFHTSLTAWAEGCSQSWRLSSCAQHPTLGEVQDEHENLSSTELGGNAALYSLLALFWLFEGISWEFWGLCWFESRYREALHSHCDAFSSFPPRPAPVCHVNVNMNHQDRSKSIKMAGFPAPAVTFRALFKPAILIVGTCRSLSEDPNRL